MVPLKGIIDCTPLKINLKGITMYKLDEEKLKKMNREEFYKERRKWRVIHSTIHPETVKTDKRLKEETRSIMFKAMYDITPAWFWECYKLTNYVWGNTEKLFCRLNVKYAPNSYPHPTRNP